VNGNVQSGVVHIWKFGYCVWRSVCVR